GREDVGALLFEDLPQDLGQGARCLDVVDAPDDPVVLVAPRILGGDVQGHIRREGPVEQAGREGVVLGQRQPGSDRVLADGVAGGGPGGGGKEPPGRRGLVYGWGGAGDTPGWATPAGTGPSRSCHEPS